MRIKIYKGKAKGNITAPPSKSMAHRFLICSALSEGTSVIKGINDSDDIKATLSCIETLGAKVKKEGTTVTVTGIDISEIKSNAVLNCNESGSTLRFLIPICLLTDRTVRFECSPHLLQRPLTVYEDLCREADLHFIHETESLTVKGPLKGGRFKVAGNISSQFISGLLFALPLLKTDSTITVTPPIESKPYINMTVKALSAYGINIIWKDENTLYIEGGQKYSAADVTVEGDYSNAAFFEALNVLGGNVQINGLNKDSLQGDSAYIKYYKMLKDGIPLINISDCPDLGPVLMAVAAAKNGVVLTGTKRLKIKETDRGLAMAEELVKFGTDITVNSNDIVIYPKGFHEPTEALNGHGDHRTVMALAVLLTLTGGIIEGAEASSKSFPDFFEKLKEAGIKTEII